MINNFIKHKKLELFCLWLLFVGVFLTYWLFSQQYTGPAYLSDEIGYLRKAATLAGFSVNEASSWHGGYALFLSPLFVVFSDPYKVWQGAMVLNATLWACSFALLFYLLRHLFPERSFTTIYFTVFVCASYPAWVTMSGYVFPTSAFVLVFMLSIVSLLKYSEISRGPLVFHSVLVGFLYWIHPMGLAVAVSSFIAVGFLCWHHRRYSNLLIQVIIAGSLITFYKFGVHAWFSEIMSPVGYSNKGHYPGILEVISCFNNTKFWLDVMKIFISQLSYVLIASFGIFVFAIEKTRVNIRLFGDSDAGFRNKYVVSNSILIFIVMSLLGTITIGSAFYAIRSISGFIRIDQLLNGRYSEMVLLPVFGVGILSFWKKKYFFIEFIFVIFSGLVLYLTINNENTVDFINLINIQSFWPLVVWPRGQVFIWFLAGSVAIAIVGLLNKRFFLLLVLPLFVLSIQQQYAWHTNILNMHSNPSNLVELIRSNFQFGSCIGYDPNLPQSPSGKQIERRNLYSFYFFNYDLRGMSSEQWLESCDGPYLTYFPNKFKDTMDAHAIAREDSSGLFMIVKDNVLSTLTLESLPSRDDLHIDLSGDSSCLIQGCFGISATDLMNYTQNGLLDNGQIRTNGINGFLFYGPYAPLKKGDYFIEVKGDFVDFDGAVFDVVSDRGETTHTIVRLADLFDPQNGTILIPVSIVSDITDIEIRLYVTEKTNLRITSYTMTSNSDRGQLAM